MHQHQHTGMNVLDLDITLQTWTLPGMVSRRMVFSLKVVSCFRPSSPSPSSSPSCVSHQHQRPSRLRHYYTRYRTVRYLPTAPAYLPTYLPTFLPTHLPRYLPAYKPGLPAQTIQSSKYFVGTTHRCRSQPRLPHDFGLPDAVPSTHASCPVPGPLSSLPAYPPSTSTSTIYSMLFALSPSSLLSLIPMLHHW